MFTWKCTRVFSVHHLKKKAGKQWNSLSIFVITFRNFLLEIAIHILNFETTLKFLRDIWVIILQVTFLELSLYNYMFRHVGLLDNVVLYYRSPPRLKLTLPWWGGFPPRSFKPSASTRRAQLSVAAKVVRPADLLKNVRYWFIID